MSDMTALLDDLSYIPPNNEHNEPTQGDIGETSNEPTQATRNEFEELYSSANEALYPGCDHVTRLDFMAKFTYFKVKAMVLWTINDFPARSSLSRWSGQGYKACPTCNEETPTLCKKNKIAYVGHRRILKEAPKMEEYTMQDANACAGKHPKHVGVEKINCNVEESKDTAKARQDLQKLGIRRPLWLTKNHKGKIVKPQAAYSFTPENRKKFCQYIKGVKLPDGFGSCFKHK
ncbi:hypothetical protein Tco_0858023 [Tanacetum coccineum]|uniref:Transposase-associated domain-containing protein n=1 Tax=Tanacetum coccineum TaxID=301880 RepID=A0ABQ5BBS6_9ASTR